MRRGFRAEAAWDCRTQRERLISKKAFETVAMKVLLWEKGRAGFLLFS